MSEYIAVFKSLADSNRLAIVEMLSGGELCACKLLEKLGISQPTLSHHMRVLGGCGLVKCRKEGRWVYYSLNAVIAAEFVGYIRAVLTPSTAEGETR